MTHETREAFSRSFGRSPEWAIRAPGRVNLIGEHTDYSGGLAVPCAIDREIRLLAAEREDGVIRARARDLEQEVCFSIDGLRRRGDFADYLQGVVFAARESGLPIGGMDLSIDGDLPMAAGLSSSAALAVAFARALADLGAWSCDSRRLAELAHRGESEWVGTGCGMLDPIAVALATRDHCLRLDCRSGEVEPIPFPSRVVRILIADSGVRRRLAKPAEAASAGDYRSRVDECALAFEAARQSGVAGPDARSLRDLAPEQLPALEARLEGRLFRRARHVVTENARVAVFCRALQEVDLDAAGQAMRSGHASLRDDFEVSIPELDHLCEVADALPGVFGSRLTGAGFGGATVHLVAASAVEAIRDELILSFEARFERRPLVEVIRPSSGVSSEAL